MKIEGWFLYVGVIVEVTVSRKLFLDILPEFVKVKIDFYEEQ